MLPTPNAHSSVAHPSECSPVSGPQQRKFGQALRQTHTHRWRPQPDSDPLQSGAATALCSHANLAVHPRSYDDGSFVRFSCQMLARSRLLLDAGSARAHGPSLRLPPRAWSWPGERAGAVRRGGLLAGGGDDAWCGSGGFHRSRISACSGACWARWRRQRSPSISSSPTKFSRFPPWITNPPHPKLAHIPRSLPNPS